MPRDLVQIPITRGGDQANPMGYAMIDVEAAKVVESMPEAWGVSFSYNKRTGTILSIDFFPHEAVEDVSIETTGEEKGEVRSLEQGSD